ncbi:hypothetical protein D3C87_1661710 [compost metagenome]
MTSGALRLKHLPTPQQIRRLCRGNGEGIELQYVCREPMCMLANRRVVCLGIDELTQATGIFQHLLRPCGLWQLYHLFLGVECEVLHFAVLARCRHLAVRYSATIVDGNVVQQLPDLLGSRVCPATVCGSRKAQKNAKSRANQHIQP